MGTVSAAEREESSAVYLVRSHVTADADGYQRKNLSRKQRNQTKSLKYFANQPLKHSWENIKANGKLYRQPFRTRQKRNSLQLWKIPALFCKRCSFWRSRNGRKKQNQRNSQSCRQ